MPPPLPPVPRFTVGLDLMYVPTPPLPHRPARVTAVHVAAASVSYMVVDGDGEERRAKESELRVLRREERKRADPHTARELFDLLG
eukprot:3021001-Prymnesium_polylepis.1